ncbi:methyl-accepting chemotaxis protein [Acetitomaculum ruminis DSM 5522]|uniref:Methyl-accepting chemotaxis protein n=1 Tax=Acetitomaculum ruminis DSM 5522 TaxID=1120918 RepID=A0A1I1AI45_9FIRM|nr:methyl-accepting chemotaxis protein [Acetitomaculum ruminis]SFB37684.1 methyl-accepting chemotaxis protein [Acetitomaculum ruminis DSM 5522]
MKLHTRISLIFGFILVIGITIIGLYSLSRTYYIGLENTFGKLEITSRLTSNQIGGRLDNYMNLAAVSGRDPIISSSDASNADKLERMSVLAKQNGFESYDVLNLKGISYLNETNYSDKDFFQSALNGTAAISDIEKCEDGFEFTIAAPLYDESLTKIQDVVCYKMEIDFLKDILSSLNLSETSYAYLIDDNGNVIVHTNEELIDKVNISEEKGALSEIYNNLTEERTGSKEYTYNNTRVLCGYSPIPGSSGWSIVVAELYTTYVHDVNSMTYQMIFILVILLITFIIISRIVANLIAKPIIRVKDSLSKIAVGDFSENIKTIKNPKKYEVAVLTNTAAMMLDRLKKIVMDSTDILEGLSNYNLKQEKMDTYPGDFNKLSDSVNKISNILNELIVEVSQSTSYVGNGSKELAQAADALAQGTTTQAGSIQNVVSDIEDMAKRINRNAQNEKTVDQQIKNLNCLIQNGNGEMTNLVEVVKEVEAMSADIQKIVGTIDSIAFQTNLLALNASVEAARAGIHGKGFAVVASEVGALAAKSSNASQQTADLIESCLSKIEEAMNCANTTFDVLTRIVENSGEISKAFEEISADTNQQVENASSIQKEIVNISNVVQSNMATAQETAASTQVLSEQADTLDNLMRRFKV